MSLTNEDSLPILLGLRVRELWSWEVSRFPRLPGESMGRFGECVDFEIRNLA